MLNDDEFIKKSVSSMRAVLKERRRTVEQFFDEHDIPYARTHAAFFLYVDLRYDAPLRRPCVDDS